MVSQKKKNYYTYIGAKQNLVLVHFTSCATLYVITKNKRVTLAIRGVRTFDTSVAIITYLLAELNSLKIKVKKLYLDRGFFSIPVIRWLQALDVPFRDACYQERKPGRYQAVS